MSLAKQLLALVSAMFLAIFAVNYFTSVQNIRSYLEFESAVHAQDTANSLGLSLSHYIADPRDPMLDTMVNTVFDSGYYHEIVLADARGEALLRKTNPGSFEGVPEWFTSLVPMQTARAESEISSGWRIAGTVAVTINPGIGYLKLWEQAQSALYYSLTAFVVALGVLFVVLRLVLRPLARIDRFALAVADGRYESLEPLPWTTEIRNVARSMNRMSAKIGTVIATLHARLDELSHRLHADELTGLDTRSTFETDVKDKLIARGSGHVFLFHLDELGPFAKRHGNEVADRFVREFADTLRRAGEAIPHANVKAYRFMGAEFAALAENLDAESALAFCESLVEGFSRLGQAFDTTSVARFGAIGFDSLSTIPGIVAGATEANEKARLIGPNSFAFSEPSARSRGADEWRELVVGVVDEGRFEIVLMARAERLSGEAAGEVVLEEAFTTVIDEQGDAVPIGTFVSVAESCGKVAELDAAVVARVIEHVRGERLRHDVAVNVSFDSMTDLEFRQRIYALFDRHREVAGQIVFSVTAYAATKDLDGFRSFIEFVHRIGAKILLKRFETRFIPLARIRELRLDYIRLARVYTDGIAGDAGKRQLVEAMQELGALVDIRIVAEAVADEADLEAIRALGLHAASR